MQFRCLLTVALAAGALGATACSDDNGDPLAITTTSAATDGSTTTEAPTTSTTLDFETEVKLAALALLEVRNEVFQQPDVARVAEYIADTCVCLGRERQIVADLSSHGRRWTGPAIVPLGITLTVNDPVSPTVTVAARQPAGAIAGPGNEEAVPDVAIAPYRVTLGTDTSGAWRINGLEGITLQQDVADRIIEEGLP